MQGNFSTSKRHSFCIQQCQNSSVSSCGDGYIKKVLEMPTIMQTQKVVGADPDICFYCFHSPSLYTAAISLFA